MDKPVDTGMETRLEQWTRKIVFYSDILDSY